MLMSTNELFKKAYDGGYAIPAINTQGGNYDIISAICLAAEEQQSPIILAHYLATGQYSGHDWFYQTAKWMADKVSVPVAIHLDHGDSYENCMKMLQIGFNSIMYDGSNLEIEDNANRTQEIVKVCHSFGVPVEAEVGELIRLDAEGNAGKISNIADPKQVRKFLNICSPDSLAVGIGNAHGYYAEVPDIRLDILEAIREFSSIPFVLHGCTGMDEDMIKKAISLGVVKINFGTQIRYQYLKYLKEGMDTDIQGHSWKLSQYAQQKLKNDVVDIIKLAGSDNKA